MSSTTNDDIHAQALKDLEAMGIEADNAETRKNIAAIRQVAERFQVRLDSDGADQAKRAADICAGILEQQKILVEAQRIGNQHLSSIKMHCMVLVLLLIAALIRFW
ncbi:hypothetical protein [Comamonas sp. C24C]